MSCRFRLEVGLVSQIQGSWEWCDVSSIKAARRTSFVSGVSKRAWLLHINALEKL